MLSHEQVQTALSARVDGEKTGIPDDAIDAHVAECTQCAAFQEQLVALSGVALFPESGGDGMAPPENLSDVILAGVEPQWRRAASARARGIAVSRVGLVLLAFLFLAWAVALLVDSSAVPQFVDTDGAGEKVLSPDARPEQATALVEAAAVRLGLAAGLGFVAYRPNAAVSLLAVMGTMFVFSLGFAVRDIALGQAAAAQLYFLGATGVSAVALVAMWAAERGFSIPDAWRALGS